MRQYTAVDGGMWPQGLLELCAGLDLPAAALTHDCLLLACNPAFAAVYCLQLPLPMDMQLLELLPSLAGSELELALERAAREGGTQRSAASVATLFLESLVVSFPQGLLLCHLDRGERQRLDEEHWQLMDSLAHAFRTPLSSIRGYAETIGMSTELQDPRSREYISHILRLSMHLNRIVSDLMFLSRLERGGFEEPREPVELLRILRDIVETRQETSAAAGLSVCLSADEGSFIVLASENALREICYNLLDNAIKYTPAGGSVEISLRRSGKALELCFADSGIGISAAERPFIFERFFRASAVRSGDYQGAGLGLCKVRGVVEMLGGRIEHRERSGPGSVFLVELPAAEGA